MARKSNKTETNEAAADRAARRAGQQAKIEWVKDLGADRGVTVASRHIGNMAALWHGYSKMSVTATRRELARLSGTSDSAVKRAITELSGLHYWAVENRPGANVYTLISRANRIELWLAQESRHRRECSEWLQAEGEWRRAVEDWLKKEAFHNWLAAEQQAREAYTTTVFAAIYKRDNIDINKAIAYAEGTWKHERAGIALGPLDVLLDKINAASDEEILSHFGPDPAADDGSPATHAPVQSDPSVGQAGPSVGRMRPISGSPVTHQWVKSKPVNCGNEPSARTSRNASSEEVQALAARRPDAGRALADEEPGTVSGCTLCNADGWVLDGDIENVDGDRLIEIWPNPDDDDACVHLECRHDMDANLEALKQFHEMAGCTVSPTGWLVLDEYLGAAEDHEYDDAGRMCA